IASGRTDIPTVALGNGYVGVAAALRFSRIQPVHLVDVTGTSIEHFHLHEAAGRPPRAIALTKLVASCPITVVTERAATSTTPPARPALRPTYSHSPLTMACSPQPLGDAYLYGCGPTLRATSRSGPACQTTA